MTIATKQDTEESVKKPHSNKEDKQSQKFLLPPISQKLLKPFLSIAGLVLIATSLSIAFYFYNQYQSTQKLLKNPNQASVEEIKGLVTRLSEIMELPSETPQIATVVDKKKLIGQPFFEHAINGDRLFIFAKAGKAVLYRPTTNKIIEVALLSNPSAAPKEQGNVAGVSTKLAGQPSPSVIQQKLKVIVYNGTTASGLAAKAQQIITQNYPAYVISLGNAVIKSYKETTVYSLKGHDVEAQQIAKLLNAKLEKNIPKGETVPVGADILVIAAK